MPRVKRGKNKNKKRKKILKKTKGYKWGRKSKKRQAKEALIKARQHSFDHRRDKKNDFRKRWQIIINAALKDTDLSYSKFIHALKVNEIDLDRKTLATLAQDYPHIFSQIVEEVS